MAHANTTTTAATTAATGAPKRNVTLRDEFGPHRGRPFLADRDDIVDPRVLLGGRGAIALEAC